MDVTDHIYGYTIRTSTPNGFSVNIYKKGNSKNKGWTDSVQLSWIATSATNNNSTADNNYRFISGTSPLSFSPVNNHNNSNVRSTTEVQFKGHYRDSNNNPILFTADPIILVTIRNQNGNTGPQQDYTFFTTVRHRYSQGFQGNAVLANPPNDKNDLANNVWVVDWIAIERQPIINSGKYYYLVHTIE